MGLALSARCVPPKVHSSELHSARCNRLRILTLLVTIVKNKSVAGISRYTHFPRAGALKLVGCDHVIQLGRTTQILYCIVFCTRCNCIAPVHEAFGVVDLLQMMCFQVSGLVRSHAILLSRVFQANVTWWIRSPGLFGDKPH